MNSSVRGLVVGCVVFGASTALAWPVSTAPTGDLDGDGLVALTDLQCMILVHEQYTLTEGVGADACLADVDCDAGYSCRPGFGLFTLCLPDCLAPPVTLGPDPAVECADPGASNDDCAGLVHKRSVDLNCDGVVNGVEFQFMVALLLDQVGGPGTPDYDNDGVLNFCDLDSDGDGTPDATDCEVLDAAVDCAPEEPCEPAEGDIATKTLNADPGDFQSLYATTPELGVWYTKRSNVVARVFVNDSSGWNINTLPGMYYGGTATLLMLRAAADWVFYSHRFPDAGNSGDRLYRYEAGSGAAVYTDLKELKSDPGDIQPDYVAVTPSLAAFHTRRSNVVSRLFTYHRASDSWAVATLPGKSTGGASVIKIMRAAGDVLFYAWTHPQFGTKGDVLHIYDAATKATQVWESKDIVANPASILPDFVHVTPQLVAMHTQFSNVTSRVLRYRTASNTWTAIDLPGKSTGGKATLSAMGADGGLLAYAYNHPTFGQKGQVVAIYDADTDQTTLHETKDVNSNPGSLIPSTFAVTESMVAFHTKLNNVVSSVMIWNRATGQWTHLALPTMYYGGKADLKGLFAAGPMAYLVYPNPASGTKGDRVYVYDAAGSTLTHTDLDQLQANPGSIVPAFTAVTPSLFVMHTQFSNVLSSVFLYNACTQQWTVEQLPGKSTGGKAVVSTLSAAGTRLDYSYRDPTWPPKGDVVARRNACDCP